MVFCVRNATSADHEAIRRLVLAAFHDNKPRETAAFLDSLRDETCIIGEWVAEESGAVLGHVAFSRASIASPEGLLQSAAMLTPLAVHPDRQRQGIGTSLTLAALAELDARGEDMFLVLGHPGYYPRFGFHAALTKGIRSPWGDTAAFMARCKTLPVGKLIVPKPIAEAP